MSSPTDGAPPPDTAGGERHLRHDAVRADRRAGPTIQADEGREGLWIADDFGADRYFVITSQCTPISEHETWVYTVVTFRFGKIGPLMRLALEPICRRIIRQDVVVLHRQTAQLRRFGEARFTSVETDLFARHIRALWRRAERGQPAPLPEVEHSVPIRF